MPRLLPAAGRAAILSVLFWALLGTPAWADRSFDLTRLVPTVDSYGLITVEGAQTPRRWELGLGAVLGYTHAPLQLDITGADNQRRHANLVSDQLALDLGLSLGLWDFLAIGATVPVAVQWYDESVVGDVDTAPKGATQTLPTGIYRGQPRQNVGLSQAGPRDPRLAVKARIWRTERFGAALLLSATLPIGDSASFLGEGTATFRPMLIGDVTLLGKLVLSGNLGFIVRGYSELRDPGTGVVLLGVGHELTWALGASYRLHRLVGLGLEMFGSAPLTGLLCRDQDGPRCPDVDLLGAAYLHPTDGLRLQIGVGGGLVGASPRRDEARIVLGVSWSPSPREGGLP